MIDKKTFERKNNNAYGFASAYDCNSRFVHASDLSQNGIFFYYLSIKKDKQLADIPSNNGHIEFAKTDLGDTQSYVSLNIGRDRYSMQIITIGLNKKDTHSMHDCIDSKVSKLLMGNVERIDATEDSVSKALLNYLQNNHELQQVTGTSPW